MTPEEMERAVARGIIRAVVKIGHEMIAAAPDDAPPEAKAVLTRLAKEKDLI